jgi:hypothetical protein
MIKHLLFQSRIPIRKSSVMAGNGRGYGLQPWLEWRI